MSLLAERAGTVPLAAELIALRAWIRPLPGALPLPFRGPAPGLPGGHVGAGRGRGLEFAELRPFQPGDDVRSIDWRRSARHGVPCTRLYQLEREQTRKFVVDLGPGMRFGTRVAFKSVAAARAAALLAWAAAESGDRVGGLAWDGSHWIESRPRPRRGGVLDLVRLLAAPPAPSAPAAETFDAGLQRLAAGLGRSDQIVVLSDFRELDAAAEARLVAIGQRADCLLVLVHDPFEAAPPPPGLYALTDGEHDALLDYSQPELRARHADAFAAHVVRLQALAASARARFARLSTEATPTQVLAACRV